MPSWARIFPCLFLLVQSLELKDLRTAEDLKRRSSRGVLDKDIDEEAFNTQKIKLEKIWTKTLTKKITLQ